MLGTPDPGRESLHVVLMALALAAAAFAGATSGLIWQSAGWGQTDESSPAEDQADSDDGADGA